MDDIKPVKPAQERAPKAPEEVIVKRPAEGVDSENPDKGYVQTAILSSMFGYWGVDRFYLGKVGTGILKLITFGGFGLWFLVDVIIALAGAARQKNVDTPLDGTTKYKPFFIKLLVTWIIIYLVLFAVQIAFISLAAPKLIDKLKQHEVCAEMDGTKECKPLQQFLDDYNKEKSSNTSLPDLQIN